MSDRISPLDGIAVAGRFGRLGDAEEPPGVVLSSRTCTGLCQVNAWPDTDKKVSAKIEAVTKLKLNGHFASPGDDDHAIMPIGPGRYLVYSTKADLELRLRKTIKPEMGPVVGLSHGRIIVRITGDKAEWVLSKGIAVDFSLGAFPVETSIAANHHETGLTIRRIDKSTFDIFVFTSLARSFWHWLEKAAGEVGYEVA